MLSTHPTSIELDVFFFAVFIIQLVFYFVNTFLQVFQIIFAVFCLQQYFINNMPIPSPRIGIKVNLFNFRKQSFNCIACIFKADFFCVCELRLIIAPHPMKICTLRNDIHRRIKIVYLISRPPMLDSFF